MDHLRRLRGKYIEHEAEVFAVMVLLVYYYLMIAVFGVDGILVVGKAVYKIRRRAREEQHQRQ